MFTILLTIFGLGVFVISLVTAGFKSAFKRLLMFAALGVILDVLMFLTLGTVLYSFH